MTPVATRPGAGAGEGSGAGVGPGAGFGSGSGTGVGAGVGDADGVGTGTAAAAAHVTDPARTRQISDAPASASTSMPTVVADPSSPVAVDPTMTRVAP
ncbi:hypothetical protein CMMCAS03_10095 [Clavibacter michiganensis subsp. michiganensis]|nr:hypothetical protein CMMCAS03_10095 [Clavibacter michiganensis subsp. michiganensis]